jgi:hypothetical protein
MARITGPDHLGRITWADGSDHWAGSPGPTARITGPEHWADNTDYNHHSDANNNTNNTNSTNNTDYTNNTNKTDYNDYTDYIDYIGCNDYYISNVAQNGFGQI